MLDELDELLGYELDSEVRGKDARIRIKTTTDAPFRFICHLEVDGQRWGSGTLIGPRTVLTAGHCLTDYSDNPLEKSRMRIIPARNGAREPLGSTTVSKFLPIPGYDDVSRTDVGIIQLTERIGDKVGWWTAIHSKRKGDSHGTSILQGSLPLPAGSLKVNLSGYPADKPPGCTTSCGTVQYFAYDESVNRKDGMLFYENDTFGGHSGCPVWVRRDASMGGRVLVGIHVGSMGAVNCAVFIDSTVRKFITDNTLR